jgi:hypothetical protein
MIWPHPTGRCWCRTSVWALLAYALTAPPAAAQTSAERRPVFRLDPVADSALFGGTLVIAAMSEAIIATGEIEAQLPDEQAELVAIDRWAAERWRCGVRVLARTSSSAKTAR